MLGRDIASDPERLSAPCQRLVVGPAAPLAGLGHGRQPRAQAPSWSGAPPSWRSSFSRSPEEAGPGQLAVPLFTSGMPGHRNHHSCWRGRSRSTCSFVRRAFLRAPAWGPGGVPHRASS